VIAYTLTVIGGTPLQTACKIKDEAKTQKLLEGVFQEYVKETLYRAGKAQELKEQCFKICRM
jgi:hypothetical protein